MNRTRYILSAVLTAALCSSALLAQPPSGSDGRVDMRDWQDLDVYELVETVRIVRLSRELGLNDEQTVLLMRKYQDAKSEFKALNQKQNKVREQLKELVKAEKSDEEISAKLNELIAVDQEIVEKKSSTYEDVAADLSVTQKAKLYVFMQEFEDNMRRLVERAHDFRQPYMRGHDGPGDAGRDDENRGDVFRRRERGFGERPNTDFQPPPRGDRPGPPAGPQNPPERDAPPPPVRPAPPAPQG